MSQTLHQYWVLFFDGFWASVVVGLTLPLIGALLLLRRSAFLGVAVPQFSAAGLAAGLWLLPWFPPLQRQFLEHGHPPTPYMFLFAVAGAGLALAIYSFLETRGRQRGAEGRLAAGFALASAVTLLFLSASPASANLSDTILRGEILLLDHHGLAQLVVVDGLVLAGLAALRRVLLLISFDPDQAVTLGHPVALYQKLWMLLVGLAIGGGVMSVGPILVFGLLFLPPLAALQVARNLTTFFGHVLVVGLLAILAAWPAAVGFDQPYGPTVVVCAALLLGGYSLAGRWRGPAAPAG